jgi:hypothetical protein
MRPHAPRFTLVLRNAFRRDGRMQEVWLDT